MIMCKECGGKMKIGKALRNTLSGRRNKDGGFDRGTTVSMTGPPTMEPVFKCQECGHSYTAPFRSLSEKKRLLAAVDDEEDKL